MVGMVPLHSYLFDCKIGGQVSYDRPNVGQFLTSEQTNYVCKKVNIDTTQQEIGQEEQLNRMDNMNGEINPY